MATSRAESGMGTRRGGGGTPHSWLTLTDGALLACDSLAGPWEDLRTNSQRLTTFTLCEAASL